MASTRSLQLPSLLRAPTLLHNQTLTRSQNLLGPTTKLISSWSQASPLAVRILCAPYHSTHHPTSAPYPPLQTRILASALTHVPQHGFTLSALRLGCTSTSHLPITVQLFSQGAYALIHYHLTTSRLSLQHTVQFPPSSPLPLHDRIRTLIWARLLLNRDVIHHWTDALATMSLLENLGSSVTELGLLADEILWLAGDTTVDFGWYTKRARIMAVYAATEVFMAGDKSEGFKETKDFLDRRISAAEGITEVVKGMGDMAGWWARAGLGMVRAAGFKV